MTEAEWGSCADPGAMLPNLYEGASVRKIRLLTAACCRRLSTFLDADTQAARSDLLGVMECRAEQLDNWVDACTGDSETAQPYEKIDGCAEIETCYFMIPNVGIAGGLELAVMYAEEKGAKGEAAEQAALVRDIFGNPFRPAGLITGCRTPTTLSIAQAAYEDRGMPSGQIVPARLAVLADALEDAGCMDDAVLTHLRLPGPHVRGCWALDAILGLT
jgi:hypothetical protein